MSLTDPFGYRTRVLWKSPDGARKGPATDAQIAGEACMLCGRGAFELEDAGTVHHRMEVTTARVCKGGCGATP